MLRTIEIDLTYQPLIQKPPVQNLFDRAAANDDLTINHWWKIWVDYAKAAKERFGKFSDHSIGKLYAINRQKPAIICGSGPSLKHSIDALRENAKSKHPVLNVSCLHNFGYFEDEGFHADYYVSLDSGDIVIDDVFEGRKQPKEHYWEQTKGKVLLATTMSSPKLFDLWQGEVYLFNVMMPNFELQKELQSIERFTHFVAPGGNALGGCLYIAKSIFCSDAIHFVGADFCFAYNNQFHSYKTHYDEPGNYIMWPDVFGNMRKTWQSYLNFKFWFDHIVSSVPGKYINCSEGILGSYREGNIMQFEYKTLEEALTPYRMMDRVFLNHIDHATGSVIKRDELELKEYFENPTFEKDVVLM